MIIQLKIEDNTTLGGVEVQDIVKGDISISESLFDSTGKMEFTLINSDIVNVSNGNMVYLYVDGKPIFKGYIFNYSTNEKNELKITTYNQLKYLTYKDTIVFDDVTATYIFQKICRDYNIKHTIKHRSEVVIAGKIQKDKSLYEMLTDAFDRTLINSGKWYAMRDVFGTLEMFDIEKEQKNIILGDESLVTSHSFSCSIESDTYNQIKLTKDNKETGKREVYIVKDSKTINKWGLLQYYEAVDENMNPAQIQERAEQLLKIKNRETKTLKLNCIGDFDILVGDGILVNISDLNKYNINNREYVIMGLNRKINSVTHTMELDLQMGV